VQDGARHLLLLVIKRFVRANHANPSLSFRKCQSVTMMTSCVKIIAQVCGTRGIEREPLVNRMCRLKPSLSSVSVEFELEGGRVRES